MLDGRFAYFLHFLILQNSYTYQILEAYPNKFVVEIR